MPRQGRNFDVGKLTATTAMPRIALIAFIAFIAVAGLPGPDARADTAGIAGWDPVIVGHCGRRAQRHRERDGGCEDDAGVHGRLIGRASWKERGCQIVVSTVVARS